MELEEDLLSKTNEALFFCDLPGNFLENLLGLEATCWKDEAVDLLHPSCCRELIFTVPDILVSPRHASSDKLYIIVKRETLHDEVFLHAMQRLKIKIEQRFEVHRELFQYCLNFTLIHRVAPLWNRLGGFLVHGMSFQ
eukprot:gene1459-15884_t